MPNYGVIDLGSNSIRLCVYEVKEDDKQHYCKKDFRSLLNNKIMAGLSAHVVEGAFTDLGVMHAVDVLRGHQKRLRYFECKRVDVFATAVLRNCTNSKQVIRKIEEATGFSITLLTEEDEAHLGFVGAASDEDIDYGTLIDIGGGSTELTKVENEKDTYNASIAQGSLSSYASFVKSILPVEKEMAAISRAVSKKVHALPNYKQFHHGIFYGVGGSLRAATKLYAELCSNGVRPDIITREQIGLLIDECRNNPDNFAHFALKAAPERIHTIVPGCIIAKRLMDEFNAEHLIVCKNGVREGYLIERMLLSKTSHQ